MARSFGQSRRPPLHCAGDAPPPRKRFIDTLWFHASALLGYLTVTIVFAWPLPVHFSTHLTGPTSGDTGIYVWNQWVFRRELIERRSDPYFTDAIFHTTDRANLSLHNYTVLADVMALPFIGRLGTVTTFNLIYLALGVLSAYAMMQLARAMVPGARLEAWLAGVVFAWSPMLVTRGTGHFSLVAAAPLPLFLLFLHRLHTRGRLLDAMLLGGTVALALWSDVYYAVYCVMIAIGYAGVQCLSVTRAAPAIGTRARVRRGLDVFALSLAALIGAMAVTGGWTFNIFGQAVTMHSLFTPVLVLTTVLGARLLDRYRLGLRKPRPALTRRMVGHWAAAVMTAGVLLLPMMHAIVVRFLSGSLVIPSHPWRNSPPGVDLLAYIVPNPNHPFAPRALDELVSLPMHPLEHVASVPLVVLGVLVVAWTRGWRPSRLWTALGVGFSLLALGPFIHVARVNTHVPGPWALLRYVPGIELARTPARMAVLVMLVIAIVFATALVHLRSRYGRLVVGMVTGLVLFELLPAPRPLYSAHVPRVFQTVAADPRDVSVLSLPLGFSSGTFTVGHGSSNPQFFQTLHHKRLFGGGLSRISERRIERVRQTPILDALLRLGDGGTLPPEEMEGLADERQRFIEQANLGYVVINRRRASAAFVGATASILRLQQIDADDGYELYVPAERSPVQRTEGSPPMPTP